MPSLNKASLSLGSNTGDSIATLRAALGQLEPHFNDFRCSAVYKTKAMYKEDQPDFYNMVCQGFWRGSAEELLQLCQGIEANLGRNRLLEEAKGPRSLDIDIVLLGDTHIAKKHLLIPHIGLLERAFVLVPLLAIDPDIRYPLDGSPLSLALAKLKTEGIYCLQEISYDTQGVR